MTTPRISTAPSSVQEFSLARLLALLRHPAVALAEEVASEFEEVHQLVGALPLTTQEYCFAHNWLTSARQLWETGDFSAAYYQVTAVARKLHLWKPEGPPPSSERTAEDDLPQRR
jgi:hypothetical protein